jgi:ABC-type uncharacterized transport system ATPase subunit
MAAVTLREATFAYAPSAPPVLRGVTLSVPRGGRLLLVGANGAGKSTLLRLIAGRRKPTGGLVESLGKPAFEATELAGQVTLVTDEWDESLCTLAPAELIASHVARHMAEAGPPGAPQARRRAETLIGVLGVDEALLACATLAACSSGQRRRVQLLLALLPPRPLIVLDEATNALDVAARAALLAFLRSESEERGATIIYCTHIFDGLDGWPTRAAHLRGGRVTHTAEAEALRHPGATYALALDWVRPPGAGHAERAVGWLLELHAHAVAEREARAGGENRPFTRPPPMPPLSPEPGRPYATPTVNGPAAPPPASSIAALPLGWRSRSVATSGAFGDHTWDYEEPPEIRGAKIARLNAGDDPDEESMHPAPAEDAPAPPTASKHAPLPSPPGGSGPMLSQDQMAEPGRPQPALLARLGTSTQSAPTAPPQLVAERCPSACNTSCNLAPPSAATAMQTSMAPVLQGALAQMQARLAACSAAVGAFDAAAVAAEAEELRRLWEQASVALNTFASQGGGGARVSSGAGSFGSIGAAYEPRLMPRPGAGAAEDKSAPRPMTGPGAVGNTLKPAAPSIAVSGDLPLGWGSRQVATSEEELIRLGLLLPESRETPP